MCKNFDFCIKRAMEFAEKGDYDTAISSFLSDVSNSECTKCISDNRFVALLILRNSSGDLVKFEKALRDFTIFANVKNNI